MITAAAFIASARVRVRRRLAIVSASAADEIGAVLESEPKPETSPVFRSLVFRSLVFRSLVFRSLVFRLDVTDGRDVPERRREVAERRELRRRSNSRRVR